MAERIVEIVDMPGDDARITEAAEVLWRAMRENWPNGWPTMEDAIAEVQEMRVPDRICRAVLMDSRVVGWIGGLPHYEGNVWELHPLAVHPDYHGRGIGRRLVEDFEREVAERGGLTIMIGTDDETGMTSLSGVNLYQDLTGKLSRIQNLRRHPYEFYERLGYTIVGVIPDANGIGKPDIYMAKAVRRARNDTKLAFTTHRDTTTERSR